jgi:hypothetical protein
VASSPLRHGFATVVVLLATAAASAASTSPADVDASRLGGPQTNPTITVDPRNPSILLAGSNSLLEGAERWYSSTDGGVSWTTGTVTPTVPDIRSTCPSDPGVAIDRAGTQYFSFDRVTPCTPDAPSRVYVATRQGPGGGWSAPVLVAKLGSARVDDKPTIAVDNSPSSPHQGRVYVAWARVSRRVVYSIQLSHSDDRGRTWSRPVKVNRAGDELNYASIAVARNGIVYVGWTDSSHYEVDVTRSTDGGDRFGPQIRAAAFEVIPIPHCGIGIVVRAEPRSCIQADPTVSVDTSGGRYSGRVYVSYTGTDFTGDGGAAVTTFDSRLRPIAGYPLLSHHRVVARFADGSRSDQFWAQSAIDQTNGSVWLCFYDTAGDGGGTRVFYSCTFSRDGGRTWTRPVHAASVSSDETQPGAAQYGYYQGVAAAGGVAHPIWTDTRDLSMYDEEIYTAALAEADLSPPAPSG